MARFSIKVSEKTDEIESPNFLNQTGLAKRSVSKLFFISIKPFLETNSN